MILLFLFHLKCLLFSFCPASILELPDWRIAVAKVGNPALLLILKEKLSVFQRWVWCLLWVFQMRIFYYYVEAVSFCLQFVECFYHKRCWILSRACSASVEMIMCCPLHSINVVCYIHWFSYHSFHPCLLAGDPPWSWCTILLICCWIQFASILMRIFVRDWMLFH